MLDFFYLAKAYVRDWLRLPPSIEDLMLVAHFRILADESITVYRMVDGQEVRKPANPIPRAARQMQALHESIAVLTHQPYTYGGTNSPYLSVHQVRGNDL